MTPTKAVEIVIPEIKISLADLAYLTSLSSGDQHCSPARQVKDRCVFLGLVEMAEIPPCPKAVKEHHDKIPPLIEECRVAFKTKDWSALGSAADRLRWNTIPKGSKGLVLTKAGKDLLATGRAKGQMTKNGCGVK